MSSSRKPRGHITQVGDIKLHKINTRSWELRDAYHWLLTLSWPAFALLVFFTYFAVNLLFSLLYCAEPHAIAGMDVQSWSNAFFFSVETLATVGYGHMYPGTVYGHWISTVEIMMGMFGMALITGLIFIRFSRPVAKILFSQCMVKSVFDGKPALIFRVANLREQAMAEAEFRIIVMREEITAEGESWRRFYPLKLQVERLILFPAIITIRHILDETSPLYGKSIEDLKKDDSRLTASVVCIDTVIPAPVQSHYTYTAENIRENHRFVEVFNSIDDHSLTVDYALMHVTEPIGC